MLTKVGRVLLNMAFNPDAFPMPSPNRFYFTDKATIPGKDYNGNDLYFCVRASSISMTVLSTAITATSNGVAFGSGNTPATENDYTIENQILGLTASVTSDNYMTFNAETDSWDLNFQFTINNPGETDVTISEMCRFVSTAKNATKGASGSGNTSVLVERIVLDAPVTIPAGEASVINYTFSRPTVIVDPVVE